MNQDHDNEKLEGFVERVFEVGCADDGVMGTWGQISKLIKTTS